ncbi:MAG TPA: hypothetical protein VII06_21695 [Chloroflexota bacterium]
MLVGLTVRLPFFLTTDFPLNDGGLFYVMSREITAAHYALPAYTAYNLEDIPFAYPPLAFYLAAALSDGLRVPLLAVVRYLPLVANLLTIAAFYALATSLVRSRYTALLAAIAFAIAPRSYEWLVMGGGLTRSLGFLCAVSSLAQAKAVYQRPSAWRLALAGTLAALALLSHLEMGLFVVESYALFFLRYGRSWQGVRVSALLGAMLVGLTAPWWLTVVGTHGLAPYAAASATAGWSTLQQSWDTLLDFTLPGHPFLAILGGIAFLGALVCALRGEPLVPVWLLAIFVLTPRSAPTEATVPLALLIGIGLTEVLSVGLLSAARQSPLLHRWHRVMRPVAPWRPRRLSFAALTVGMVAFCTLVLPPWLPPHNGTYALEALPGPEREVMAWIAEHTPDTSTFLVLSPKRSWEADYILEWFPALARRKSLLTPQGAEWLPAQVHARRTCLYNRLRALPTDSLPDLEGWLARLQVAYSHVYISGLAPGDVDLEPLRDAFRTSPGYRVLWDDSGATVLVRTDTVVQAGATDGEPAIAPDCQTLFDQPIEAQATFSAVFGDLAPRMWMQEHTRDLQALKPLPAFPGTAFAAANHQ